MRQRTDEAYSGRSSKGTNHPKYQPVRPAGWRSVSSLGVRRLGPLRPLAGDQPVGLADELIVVARVEGFQREPRTAGWLTS